MGKESRARVLKDHQAMAIARNIRVSPRKLNLVAQASVGKNLVMKRFHARARGNAGGIEKFFSQITIVVEEKREEEPKQAEAKAAAPKGKTAGKTAKKTSGKSPAKK